MYHINPTLSLRSHVKIIAVFFTLAVLQFGFADTALAQAFIGLEEMKIHGLISEPGYPADGFSFDIKCTSSLVDVDTSKNSVAAQCTVIEKPVEKGFLQRPSYLP